MKAFSLMTKCILGPKEQFQLAWRRKFLFTEKILNFKNFTECILLTQTQNCWFFSFSWFRLGISSESMCASQYPALWQNKIVPACTSCTNLKVTILLNKSQFSHGHQKSNSPLEAFSLYSFHLCEVLPYSPHTYFSSPGFVSLTQTCSFN